MVKMRLPPSTALTLLTVTLPGTSVGVSVAVGGRVFVGVGVRLAVGEAVGDAVGVGFVATEGTATPE